MPYFCGSRPASRPKRPIRLLGQAAARALGEQGVLGAQFHAAGEAVLGLAVLADPHVAGGDARDRAVGVVEHLGGREARVDFDPQRFGLGGQPAADIAERDHVVAVVVHQRRHEKIRQPQRTRRSQEIKPVRRDRGLDRRVLAAPVGQQPVETDRVDHGAGKNVGSDFGALFDHDHGHVRRQLLEPDGGSQPCRPGTDDDDVEFHRFTGRCI